MKFDLYDFDGTIYDGDSGIDIILFAMRRYPKIIIPSFWYLFLYLIKVINKCEFKSRIFSFVKYVDDLDEFINMFWKKNEHKVKKFWINKKNHKNDIIISASCDFWLDPFAKKYKIYDLFSTKYDIKSCKVIGDNCHGTEKVRLFFKKYPNAIINRMYTDSKNDFPLVERAKKGFLVKKNDIYDYYSYGNTGFFKKFFDAFRSFCNFDNEIFMYLLFGFLTVLINLIIKWSLWFTICDSTGVGYYNQQFPVDVSWFVAVVFAYFTNKKYVFKCKKKNSLFQIFSFFGCRILTLFFEKIMTYFFFSILLLNSGLSLVIITLVIQFIIIILNYFFSKFMVFVK